MESTPCRGCGPPPWQGVRIGISVLCGITSDNFHCCLSQLCCYSNNVIIIITITSICHKDFLFDVASWWRSKAETHWPNIKISSRAPSHLVLYCQHFFATWNVKLCQRDADFICSKICLHFALRVFRDSFKVSGPAWPPHSLGRSRGWSCGRT